MKPANRLNMVITLLLFLVSSAWCFPLEGKELDSAVEGVQKYLESSGFPKMTRGEVLDFLNDFSRSSRVSRSDSTNQFNKDATVTLRPDIVPSETPVKVLQKDDTKSTSLPNIPNGESPLNYGYPMSINKRTERLLTTSTPMIFVTASNLDQVNDTKSDNTFRATYSNVRNVSKKNIGPSVDINAYTKFKKIPEAKNLKIDNEMKEFLGGFGLLDEPKSGKSININEPQRRYDDDSINAETVDQMLLESVLLETGNSEVNASQLQPLLESVSTRDHVFNPSDSHVKTVDVNRIAKIVENIRLLTDDNNTISLPHDDIQKKLDNITAAIAAIDQPTTNDKSFNGYEVFFDDNSKEIDSDLPESPATPATVLLNKIQNPPDPLSTDELQLLLEKNKNDVKRQEPAESTSTTTTEESVAVSTSSEAVVTSMTTDSSSEATSVEVTSGASVARDSSTSTSSDANPSLSQLAESFGGGETASSAPSTDMLDIPANRPRNGLYFYVDWNSFLTVNEGQKNQVNLRFAPKAGNPAHFLRVTVP